MLQLQSAFGVIALLVLAWVFGENRRAVSLRQAATGLIATILTALALIKLPFVTHAFVLQVESWTRGRERVGRDYLMSFVVCESTII